MEEDKDKSFDMPMFGPAIDIFANEYVKIDIQVSTSDEIVKQMKELVEKIKAVPYAGLDHKQMGEVREELDGS